MTRIYTAIGGTAAQREALHFLEEKELNAGYLDCMASNGEPMQLKFVTLWSGFSPNPSAGRWMGRLDVRPSVMALANSEAAHLEHEPPPPPDSREATEEFQNTMRSCLQKNQEVVVDDEALGKPATGELNAEFHMLIEDVDQSLGPIDPYNECMKQAGFDVTSRDDGDLEGWNALYDLLSSRQPRAPERSAGGAVTWGNVWVRPAWRL
ncbi:MAG: hypothetical protein QM714_06615 [Nocardioides sp.]|uniref:hypothetical protein n=1 Tax=Nocardioides sp. TaxID=35761 RepID=UPI0039E47B1D